VVRSCEYCTEPPRPMKGRELIAKVGVCGLLMKDSVSCTES
jgi:hypothetical protein